MRAGILYVTPLVSFSNKVVLTGSSPLPPFDDVFPMVHWRSGEYNMLQMHDKSYLVLSSCSNNLYSTDSRAEFTVQRLLIASCDCIASNSIKRTQEMHKKALTFTCHSLRVLPLIFACKALWCREFTPHQEYLVFTTLLWVHLEKIRH